MPSRQNRKKLFIEHARTQIRFWDERISAMSSNVSNRVDLNRQTADDHLKAIRTLRARAKGILMQIDSASSFSSTTAIEELRAEWDRTPRLLGTALQ